MESSPLGIITQCPTCSSPVVRDHPRRRYCSTECREVNVNRRRAHPADRICVVCEAKFTTSQSNRRACSPECSDRLVQLRREGSIAERHEAECPVCGSFFSAIKRQIYCGKDCANAIKRRSTDPVSRRRWKLFKRYSISGDMYLRMYREQDGKCAICGTGDPGMQKNCKQTIDESGVNWSFCVDHDHGCCSGERSCGKCVRALICRGCNSGLGQFKDSPDILTAALAYLLAHSRDPANAS